MSDVNPYASPLVIGPPGGVAASEGGIWRDGNTLVMAKGAVLPDRCVRCNAPGGVRFKRNLSWHPSWILIFLVFGGIPVVLILALILSKRAKVEFSLCQYHARKRNKVMAIWFGLALVSALVAALGFWQESPAVGGFGILATLIFLIIGAVVTPIVQPKKIDAHYVWLKKVSPAFLAELPAA